MTSKDFQSLVTILDNAVHHGGEFPSDPIYIVMHTTEGDSFKSSMDYLNTTTDKQASYHYGIERDGRIIRMTNPKLVAYHCGDSQWPDPITATKENPKPHGGKSLNKKSIGIAWANHGNESLTQLQEASALWLIKVYCRRFDIPSANVLGHLEIAPGRKNDPDCISMNDWRRRVGEMLGE